LHAWLTGRPGVATTTGRVSGAQLLHAPPDRPEPASLVHEQPAVRLNGRAGPGRTLPNRVLAATEGLHERTRAGPPRHVCLHRRCTSVPPTPELPARDRAMTAGGVHRG